MNINVENMSSRQSLINLYNEMKNYICEGYDCEFCDVCPLGEFWKTSEEGIEGCNEYQRQILQYSDICNQSIYKDESKIMKKVKEN